jgi:hypothetical protein
MGVSLHDILSQFEYDLVRFSDKITAFCTVDMDRPPKVHLWTLLDHRNEEIEHSITLAERRIRHTFPQVEFDFTTVHLLGRDPLQFIPEGAISVFKRDMLHRRMVDAKS